METVTGVDILGSLRDDVVPSVPENGQAGPEVIDALETADVEPSMPPQS